MDRRDYSKKLNEYFKKCGVDYKYQKNDRNIYSLLCQYGSLEMAKRNAKRISDEHQKDLPSLSESCTHVYQFFEQIDERLKELE